jgi:hypothetical protein
MMDGEVVKKLFLLPIDCSEDRARETLERVMSQALLKARRRRSNVCAVCLAVAGVNHPVDQQRMVDWLRSAHTSSTYIYPIQRNY